MRIVGVALAATWVGLAVSGMEPRPSWGEEAERSPDQQAIYALGTGMARDLQRLDISKEELAILKAGMDAYFEGKGANLSDPSVIENVRRFQRARIQAAIDDEREGSRKFLEEAAAQPGAVRLESGLVFRELEAGEGSAPTPEDTLRVTYQGRLRDGTVFEKVLDPERPSEVPLAEAIPCWQEALQRMKPGGKARFHCPPDLAYGNAGREPSIAPGAALEFELRLLGRVDPAQAEAQGATPRTTPHP